MGGYVGRLVTTLFSNLSLLLQSFINLLIEGELTLDANTPTLCRNKFRLVTFVLIKRRG